MRRLVPARAGARAIAGLVALFVALNVLALILSTLRPDPGGAAGSAYATQPLGAAAYAELLRRAGHDVRYRRAPLGGARLSPRQTVVVLDAPPLDAAARAALRRFVRDGGRLVVGGPNAGRGIVARAPTWASRGPTLARPSAPIAETRSLRTIRSAGAGGFRRLRGTLAALGVAPALLAVAESGAGRALLLADAAPLHNRLLARDDNAALGLALAGPGRRTVTFVESVHGYGPRSGLAALPARWRWALGIAAAAALLALLARARRLGPPEPAGDEPAPARREHVDALARGLRRCADPDAALAAVRAAARGQVVRRAALASGAPDGEVREAALRLGFEEDEAAALTEAGGASDPFALGRALARGRR